MGLFDYVALAVILCIIGGAVAYIHHSKKKGKKCIGCPDSGCCSRTDCSCCSSCQCGH